MWGLDDNWVTTSQKVKVSDLERTNMIPREEMDLSIF